MSKASAWTMSFRSLCDRARRSISFLFTSAMLISHGDGGGFAWAASGFVQSPERIYKANADTVVRIEVRLRNQVISTGSGFFVSRDGEIITSQHVVRPLLHHPQAEIVIRSRDLKTYRDVKLASCSSADLNFGIDLCHLKVNGRRATPYLKATRRQPAPGEAVAVIGHPRGLAYSITTGIVSGLRKSANPTMGQALMSLANGQPQGSQADEIQPNEFQPDEIQIDAAINPGNSGGPIFGKHGDLIGVVYQTEREGQNISFGLSASRLRSFMARSKLRGFRKIHDARQYELNQVAQQADLWISKQIAPHLISLNGLKSSSQGKEWRWARLAVGRQNVRALVPKTFQACQRLETLSDSGHRSIAPIQNAAMNQASACVSSAGEWQLSLQSRTKPHSVGLMSFRNRRMVEARPLQIVSQLELEGRGENLTTQLHPDFVSRPGLAQCFAMELKANGERRLPLGDAANLNYVTLHPNSLWKDALSVCRFLTLNDQEPGAVSASVWIETPQAWYEVSVWSVHPAHHRLVGQIADMIARSLTEETRRESNPVVPRQTEGPSRHDQRQSVGLTHGK